MGGQERRSALVEALQTASSPLSGSALAERFGVSRQVIVQDVALLRSQGRAVLSTNRGYVLAPAAPAAPGRPARLFKTCHTVEQTADELTCIVDLGGRVEDVQVSFLTQKLTLVADEARFDEIVEKAVKACRRVGPDCEIVR